VPVAAAAVIAPGVGSTSSLTGAFTDGACPTLAFAVADGSAAGAAVASVSGPAAGVVCSRTGRPPALRAATLAAAAALAAVAAFAVAALVAALVAAVAVVALAVALTAVVDATFLVAIPAALARAATAPAAAAAAFAPDVRRVRRVRATSSVVVVGVDPERCAVPWRCVGTGLVVSSSAGRRDVPRAGARAAADPVSGLVPSARGRSWWSELMHLTSVGGHSTCTPGERSGPYVNMS
jgi:hypothetical protein